MARAVVCERSGFFRRRAKPELEASDYRSSARALFTPQRRCCERLYGNAPVTARGASRAKAVTGAPEAGLEPAPRARVTVATPGHRDHGGAGLHRILTRSVAIPPPVRHDFGDTRPPPPPLTEASWPPLLPHATATWKAVLKS